MKQEILQERNRISSLIRKLEKQLQTLPAGTFYATKNGKSFKWFRYQNGKKTYIKKSDLAFAKALAAATFHRMLLEESQTELSALNAYLRNAPKESSLENYLQTHEELLRLISSDPNIMWSQSTGQMQPPATGYQTAPTAGQQPVPSPGQMQSSAPGHQPKPTSAQMQPPVPGSQPDPSTGQLLNPYTVQRPTPDEIQTWMNTPYTHLKSDYKGTTYKTMKGDLVKSQAEKDIADCLFLRGIPYRYECQISFDNGRICYYPDFTILDPRTGQIYLWEHFGMTELNYYLLKNADKMYQYFVNGYVPGQKLICTVSDDKIKLTKARIEETINYYFS